MQSLKKRGIMLGIILVMMVSAPSRTTPAPIPPTARPFYEGKVITIIVGDEAGNPFDSAARLLARHMPKYLLGVRSIIVQNMPGGGRLLAPNDVYNRVKPDGLTFGISNPAIIIEQIVGREGVQFDGRRFWWLGSATTEQRIAVMRKDTPYQSIEAIRTAQQPPKIGYTNTGSGFYQLSRLMEDILNIKLNLIGGFTSQAPIALAVERGDLAGVIGFGHASLVVTYGRWLKDDFVTVITQTGVWDPSSKSFKRHPDFPNVRTLWELSPSNKRPIIITAIAPISPIRPFYAPPGVPPDRVKILRDALWATFNDPEYQAEAKKVFGMEPENLLPVKGEYLQQIMEEALNTTPELVNELKRLYK